MRPRKKILLMCGSEFHRNTLRFLLETRGHYRVFPSPDCEDSLWLMKHKQVDLVMAEMTAREVDGEQLCEQVRRLDSRIPTLLFSRQCSDYERGGVADRFIPEIHCNSEVILSTVHIALARKRGPKPQLVVA